MSESTQPILTPEFALLGSGHRSADTYRQSLLCLYTRPKMQHLNFDHWTMTELRTYKDKKTAVNHEYLIATFTDGGEGKVHLRMERRIQHSTAKDLFQRGPKKSDFPSDSDDQCQTIFKMWADDDVSLYPGGQDEKDDKKEKIPVDHIAFPEGGRINLPQLVLLACAIRQYSTASHLTHNCSWFCYTAVEALKTRFPQFQSLPVQGKSQQGTWLALPVGIYSKDVDIAKLLARTDAMYDAFKKEIDEIINNPDNKHTKETMKIAEKENERVEEQKRRADEEACLRADAERRLEQEKKEKKELEGRNAELEAKLAAQAKAAA